MPLNTKNHQSQFNIDPEADARLQQMLTLYKNPGTIRETKEVFFYVQVTAPTIVGSWLYATFNIETPGDTNQQAFSEAPFFGPIGTQVTFDIAEKVNDLLDVRVPKDKYMFDINLVECTIESDTSNWVKKKDWGVWLDNDTQLVDPVRPTFTTRNIRGAQVGGSTNPPRYEINQEVDEATLQSTPQTLYCRIKELSNGEPYNWSITNSGDYSIDKGHQLVARHGDITTTQLTLEYGHLAITGNFGQSPRDPRWVGTGPGDQVYLSRDLPDQSGRYDRFRYLDYNQQYYNAIYEKVISMGTGVVTPSQKYPTCYAGDYGPLGKLPIGASPAQQLAWAKTPVDNLVQYGGQVEQPSFIPIADRSPFYQTQADIADPNDPPDPGAANFFLWQGKPLFYSQQVGKLNFRFNVRIVTLF